MKQQSNIGLVYLLMVSFFFLTACSPGKEIASGDAKEEIVQAINNDNWIFTAYNSNPQSGRPTSSLSGINEAKYTKDSLIVYLPYFGRLYSGSEALNTRGPLDFTSTDLDVAKEKKNNSWIVTIKPKDHNPVQAMYFTLYENGNAQLNITLTNRSPISYTGAISKAADK